MLSKDFFKQDDHRFIVAVGLKVCSISLIITTIIYWFIYQILKLNFAFFKAYNPNFDLQIDSFLHIIGSKTIDNLMVIFAFHVLLFFVGCYLGWLILRPFKLIGDYSEKTLSNPNIPYEVETFSAYGLLTRFSEFFFEYLRDIRNKKTIVSNSIPPQFSKIHQPILDKIFLLHFGLFILFFQITSSYFIIESSSSMIESIVELFIKKISKLSGGENFLMEQLLLPNDIFWMTIILITIFYLMLSFHLYAKVSGAAFAIFSTMRSFMRGAYSNRVHLLGFSHVRSHTRKLNKYLDYIENNFVKEQPKK